MWEHSPKWARKCRVLCWAGLSCLLPAKCGIPPTPPLLKSVFTHLQPWEGSQVENIPDFPAVCYRPCLVFFCYFERSLIVPAEYQSYHKENLKSRLPCLGGGSSSTVVLGGSWFDDNRERMVPFPGNAP